MPRSWSARWQEVRKRRLTAAGLRYTELVGIDWEISSSIGLTRRQRKP
jgi:hypothetical protein